MLPPPILPLAPHQAIWHAPDHVRCIRSTGKFIAGRTYPMVRDTAAITRPANDIGGQWRIQSIETEVAIWPDSGSPMVFSLRPDGLPIISGSLLKTHPITELHTYFELLDVPDIATVHAEQHATLMRRIDARNWPENFKPKPFQRDQIARTALRDQALISWEPGLGKTLAAYLFPILKNAKRTLIICPASLIPQTRQFGYQKIGILPTMLRKPEDIARIRAFAITSYDALFHQKNGLLAACIRAKFDAVVIDEATAIQNPETHAGHGIWSLRAPIRLAMTATPIKNKINSLANLIAWIDPAIQPSTIAARKRLIATWSERHTATATEIVPTGIRPRKRHYPGNLHHLWAHAAPLVCRLRKSDTQEPFAKLDIQTHIVAPDKTLWQHYQRALRSQRDISTFQRLLGISCGIYGETSAAQITHKALKNIAIAKANLHAPVLIGSTRTAYSDLIQEQLRRHGIHAEIADGRTTPEARAEIAKRFRANQLPVLIASLDCMAQGHDFPNCPTLILPTISLAYDANEQLLHRIWRLSTTTDITVHLIVTAHTADQRAAEIYLEKREMTKLVIDGGTDIPEDVASDLDRPEIWDSILTLAHITPAMEELPTTTTP